jgi:transposase
MPQIQLPIFPTSCAHITDELAFERREGIVYYFNGHLPVFSHRQDDVASFRFFTSQLVANGNASQSQIARAFGVPLVTVKRACKKLRTEGAVGFFRPAPPRQGHKLTDERIARAQALLDEGLDVPAIGAQLGVLPNTLHKAISHGRLKKKTSQRPPRLP